MREARVSYNRGGPENPPSIEELKAKFRSNAERALPGDLTKELEKKPLTLDRLEDVGDPIALRQPR